MSPSDFSVLVFDMSRTGEPDGERVVGGFASLEAATAYAEARVRSSVEELRKPNQSSAELRSLWHIFGEDCSVLGGGYKGRDSLDRYIAEPATPEQTAWTALAPQEPPIRPRRFHAFVSYSAGDPTRAENWVIVGGYLNRAERPTRQDLFDIYLDDAKRAFAEKGVADVPTEVSIVHLFELFDPPQPPEDGRPPKHWRIGIEFVCHDVKFGGSASGVFAWPDKPDGHTLAQIQRVLVGDMMALRGDGPDYADYSEVLATTITETTDPLDPPACGAAGVERVVKSD